METNSTYNPDEYRLEQNEAWARCKECFSRLFSFYGSDDILRPCPYYDKETKDCKPTFKDN